jgi:hypothetical protein
MPRSNDGVSCQSQFYPRLPGQDRAHFPLGTSEAKPAAGYFGAWAGLSSDKEIENAIAGLSDIGQIRGALIRLAGPEFARVHKASRAGGREIMPRGDTAGVIDLDRHVS